MNPRVTAVIPAYNAARWVGAAIRSVLAQSYGSLELVVVDDGSSDGTAEVVRGFSPKVKYVRQENSGVCAARNRGAREGVGEFVAFLDADDEWLPSKVESQVRRLDARPEAVASFTNSVMFDDLTGTQALRRNSQAEDLVRDLLLHSCVIGDSSSVMIRKRIFDQLGGFDPRFSQCADWDMWLRLAESGPVDLLDEGLTRYRKNHVSMSSNIRLLEKDTLGVLEKFFSSPSHRARFDSLSRKIYSNHFLILSGSYLHARSFPDSIRCLKEAAHRNPLAMLRAAGMPFRAVNRLINKSLQ